MKGSVTIRYTISKGIYFCVFIEIYETNHFIPGFKYPYKIAKFINYQSFQIRYLWRYFKLSYTCPVRSQLHTSFKFVDFNNNLNAFAYPWQHMYCLFACVNTPLEFEIL